MSTVTDIESAFADYVFANASIAEISPNLFKFEIRDVSEIESSRLYYKQELNYWEMVVSQVIGPKIIGSVSQANLQFPVEIRYTRYADPSGDNYRAVRDAFITLANVVESAIGQQWNSTVDYFAHQDGPAEIALEEVAATPCIRGVYRFNGFKFSSI